MKMLCKEISINKTAEGVMIPIYRDWDSLIPGYKPAMVYATTIGPCMKKGPILHKKRSGYMTAIGGEAVIEYLEDGHIKNINLSVDDSHVRVVFIPPETPIRIVNNSKTEVSTVINLPNIAWHPENQDTEKFEDWENFFKHV